MSAARTDTPVMLAGTAAGTAVGSFPRTPWPQWMLRLADGWPVGPLNTRWHRRALGLFLVVVIAHWLEHIFQVAQISMLGWHPKEALGLLGLVAPALVTEEWLHYVYNAAIWGGLILLAPAFTGAAAGWWKGAIVVQTWHHVEHLLLLGQAITGLHLLGLETPTSIVQLFVPRLELHLFYNAIATVPMLLAAALHRRAPSDPNCPCGCVVQGGMVNAPSTA